MFKVNGGLEINGDGKVTVGEATAKAAEQLQVGLRPGNLGQRRRYCRLPYPPPVGVVMITASPALSTV